MKKFKKIMALAIAMVMVLSMSMAVFADASDPTTTDDGKVTLSVTGPVEGHTYKYLQLFTGDLSGSDDSKLSNVKWGADVAPSIKYYEKADAEATTFTVEKTINPTVGDSVPQVVLDYLASLASKAATQDGTPGAAAQDTADIISAWVTGDGTEIPAAGVKVDPGYYVVKDAYTDSTADQTTTLSTNIIAVVDDVAITPKAGTTEHEKKVLDVNDTTDTALDLTKLKDVADASWLDSADHDFGDKVPFKLTTTIASDFAKYDEYFLKVSDTLGTGLKLDQSSIEVYVDGVKATAGAADAKDGTYNVAVNGQTFTITFAKLNGNTNAAAGKKVVVYYTATLDKDSAVIGNDGNPNTSYAEFSNNPNGDQEGTAKTPEDTVVVFTYKTDVDKIDADGNALKGAGFTLYKKYKAEVAGKTNAAAELGKTGEFWYAVGDEVKGTDVTNFEFKGIDDGTYLFVETTTPEGYNTIDPITIVVTATHEAKEGSTYGYAITSLDAGNNDFAAAANGGEVKFTKKNKTEKTLASGEIYSEIVNNSGTVLPSTGGIGTTIFYIIGAILVIGAGVVLVTRRRMSAN